MDQISRLGVVAVVPFWSQSDNLNVDSNYAYLRVVLPQMEKMTEDTLFLVFFPDPKAGRDKWRYHPDGFVTDRIKLIPWPYDTAMLSSVTGFDVERWYDIERYHGPTMYWLHQVESGPFLHGGYHHSYAVASQPAMIAQHHYIIHQSLPYPTDTLFSRLWLQIGGAMASERVVYNSRHCRAMAEEAFSRYLREEAWNEMDARSEVLLFGLLSGEEPVAPEATDEPITVLYNHRFERYKNPRVTFDLLDELRTRYPVRVWVTQAAGQMTGGAKAFHFDECIFEPSRMDYLRRAAVPAVNTINSEHETFCIAMLDSLALGHLAVVPNAITFPELVPEGYPYLFNSVEEQRSMLNHIFSTWPDEYNKWRIPLSEHARSTFRLDQYCHRYLSLMAEAEATHRTQEPKDTTLQGLHQLFDAMQPGEGYAPDALRRKFSPPGKGSGMQSMPTRRIVREAMALRPDVHIKWDHGVKLYRTV